MFEQRHHPLLPAQQFYKRLMAGVLLGMSIIFISLFLGMIGYRLTEGMSWTDAFVNAAMILSGMGPMSPLTTAPGKLFAGCYVLYSGLALISIAGVMFAPVVHRFLHKFYLEGK